MRFREVLSIGSFSLKQVRHSIQPKTINTHTTPKINYLKNFVLDFWVVIIKIGLMLKEAMPVILLRHLIPCPVTALKILENNSNIFIFRRIITPHIVIPFVGISRRSPCSLKPMMLIRSMIDDELRDHFQVATMRLFQKLLKLINIPVGSIDAVVIRNIISIILKG